MNSEQNVAPLQGYLQTLDPEQLDQALNEVLAEIRRREADQMKKDVLTHSQQLRLKKRIVP